ncbi:Toxin CrTX-A [Exaiptasia diaphana]|nr:Toxin CrTX-A [Exaiptasia diaphana]
MAEELENETPDKNDEQYNNQSIIELQDAAPKDKLITAVRTKLSAFKDPSLASRAKESLSSLDKKWYDFSDANKQRALNNFSVISSNIKAYGNAGEDPVGAIRGAIDIVASLSSNFGPKGQLASVAMGFVSALLGLFGKGPKPKPLGEIVREQINEALEEYHDEELTRKADGLLTAFRHTKAYLDGAAESGKPFSKDERAVVAKEVERTQGVAFMGELAYAVRKMFKNNKPSDARKAIRYCEMYAQLAVIRDIILTQYIAMIPKDWENHLNGIIRDRALMRRVTKTLLETFYIVDYDSLIMPYFDADVSVITDAYSTKMLNMGNYDRSMAGLHSLMNPGRSGLEVVDWKTEPRMFRPSNNPYISIVKPHNDLCYWKLVPHA